MPKERDIIKIIWTNFVKSLRRQGLPPKGNLMGQDYFGNKYFQIPADRSVGKRRDERWFEPAAKDRFDEEMPAEWEAWLRGRRKEPPTDEEVLRNKAIADMKKVNAAELDKEYHPEKALKPKEESVQSFPKYDEYEVMPGDSQDYKKKKS